jgi:hypothetical protein
VLLVGGHERLRHRAQAEIESWGVTVDWLLGDEAKQGRRLPALVRGNCDLVVVNTAHIGHAASGRAFAEAQSAGKRAIPQPGNGVGSLLLGLWNELAELREGQAPAAAKSRAAARSRLVRH